LYVHFLSASTSQTEIVRVSIVQQFLSIPVYTIFKNMTIILIAYGEVIWFGGSVTSLTLVSFALMVRSLRSIFLQQCTDPDSFQVLSSLTAAYTDISAAFIPVAIGTPVKSNIGYAWMVVRSSPLFSPQLVLI
jgi:GDP-mannose transporter